MTSWSAAFKPRRAQTPPTTSSANDQQAPFQSLPQDTGQQPQANVEQTPIDTTGKTRAQLKAEEYDRACGQVWRNYQTCLTVGRRSCSFSMIWFAWCVGCSKGSQCRKRLQRIQAYRHCSNKLDQNIHCRVCKDWKGQRGMRKQSWIEPVVSCLVWLNDNEHDAAGRSCCGNPACMHDKRLSSQTQLL